LRRDAAPALVVLTAFTALTACSGGAGKPGPRVLLVTLDTTRADHLSAYGYVRGTTPHFDALARRGVLFTRAYCNMPTTDPSHASFLTGTYPRRHGITRNGLRAVPGLPSLPEALRRAGLRTAAFLSRRHLDPREMGIPGFEVVDVPDGKERRADATAESALRWLRRRGEGAWFVWVHLFDPHSPYEPPSPFDTWHGPGPAERRLGKMGWLEAARYEPAVLANNVRLYDGEISFADDRLGALAAAAEDLPGEPPLLVVVADHGESLGELEDRFGYAFAHGEFLYDHQTRVPLVMRRRGDLPEGRVAEGLVEGVDLPPTILDLLGLGGLPGADGTSRAALARGGQEAGAEEVFIQRRSFKVPEQPYLAAAEYAVVRGWTKLITNPLKGEGVELYDLRADPGEVSNLAGGQPERLRELRARLERWLAAVPASDPEAEPTEEKLKDLRSLGYVN
jgi:arylsulfatase A-like enzyme